MRFRTPLLVDLWRREFGGYSRALFNRDLIAGLTVAAVALPLALAFGVASGSTAAAGLVTAILAGLIIGALSGAPYQISGPTGAMSAVLILVVQQHGLHGLWLAALMAGLIVLALGVFRLGRIINFIPAPVITGFTSGIALVIAIGQLDNALGITTAGAHSSALKLLGYVTAPPPTLNGYAVACTLGAIATMLLLPRLRFGGRLPAALLGVALVTVLAGLFRWPVAPIGTIPATLVLPDRYIPARGDLAILPDLLGPAVAIAALGAIESLLARAVAGRMVGKKLLVNQELVAQGLGNLIIPFFGGVPATAAIARMSVGVKAGGVTRLTGFIHAITLLVGALAFGPLIGRIPLAGLAGVLLVTAYRMNEWHALRLYVARRLKGPIPDDDRDDGRHRRPRPDAGDRGRRHPQPRLLPGPGLARGDRRHAGRSHAPARGASGARGGARWGADRLHHRGALLRRDRATNRGTRTAPARAGINPLDARGADDRRIEHPRARTPLARAGTVGWGRVHLRRAATGTADARTLRPGGPLRRGIVLLGC